MCQKKPEVIKGNVRSFGMYCIIRLVYGIGNSLQEPMERDWSGLERAMNISQVGFSFHFVARECKPTLSLKMRRAHQIDF